MFAEYSCAFGISGAVSGLNSGELIAFSHDLLTILAIVGKDNHVFWFLIRKLKNKYIYPDVPRYSQDDAIDVCQSYQDLPIFNGVTFGDIWNNREVFSMTALEENVFRTWHIGRVVCFGDSMHKVVSLP